MATEFNFWQFIGGIGLFLFAMSQLEEALQQFAGRPLKRFLRDHTDSAFKSVLIGIFSTSIVQSSSLVGLMVLAFVGASIMSLTNALGVIFGANLGTTLTGWVVATVGFKMDLSSVALPLIGIGSLAFVGLRGRGAEFGRFVAALGFLLMGISLMKESVGSLSQAFDVARLAGLSSVQYLLFGVVFAAIVQSSSAVMMVTLAALQTGVIELPAAAAIAVGADLGTTTTVLLGSVKGAAGKKRVALAHMIFNVTTAVLAFALLTPLLGVVAAIGIRDPLYSLVAFHSLFNFLGIVIFMPIIKPFAQFLTRRFIQASRKESLFVSETDATVSDAAIAAITKETAHIIARVIRLNMRVFSPPLPTPPGKLSTDIPLEHDEQLHGNYDELYRRNKVLEGEILNFGLRVQAQPLEPEQSERLNGLLGAVRNALNSAKSLRDVRHNLEEFADSGNRNVLAYQDHFRAVMTGFYGQVYRLDLEVDAQVIFQDFAFLMESVRGWYDQLHHEIYGDVHDGELADNEISSLLNVNRELLNSNTALVLALRQFTLKQGEEAVLDQLPG